MLAHRRLGDVVVAIVVHLPPPEPPLELDGRGPAAGNAGELHVVAHVANGSGQQERSEHGRFFFFLGGNEGSLVILSERGLTLKLIIYLNLNNNVISKTFYLKIQIPPLTDMK